MMQQPKFEEEQIDRAVADIFHSDPDCGVFGNIDTLSKRRDINEILEMARAKESMARQNENVHRFTRRRYVYIGVAASIIALAGALIYSHLIPFLLDTPAYRTAWFGEVAHTSGALYMDERLADNTAPIPVARRLSTLGGTAMLRLPTGIDWFMQPHTQGNIHPVSETTLKVALDSGEGWFRVNPSRRGPAFSVVTPHGEIHVTGTIFVVNVTPADVRVTLLKGEVSITTTAGAHTRLKAGHTLQLKTGDGQMATKTPVEATALRQYQTQLVDLKWADAPESIKEAAVAVQPEQAEMTNTRNVRPRKQLPTISESKLLKEIRRQRQLRNWDSVASLYQQLINSAPRSETAIVSCVSLGEIYENRLHRHRDALQYFNKYLQSGHTALIPEATIGKCKALRGTGNQVKEKQCLQKFIQQFPGAFQTPDAKTRLGSLK